MEMRFVPLIGTALFVLYIVCDDAYRFGRCQMVIDGRIPECRTDWQPADPIRNTAEGSGRTVIAAATTSGVFNVPR